MFKIRIEFKLADMWIGVFWKRSPGQIPCHESTATKAWMWGKDIITTHVWICLLPCVPIHITWTTLVKPHDDHVDSKAIAYNGGILRHGRPDLVVMDDVDEAPNVSPDKLEASRKALAKFVQENPRTQPPKSMRVKDDWMEPRNRMLYDDGQGEDTEARDQ